MKVALNEQANIHVSVEKGMKVEIHTAEPLVPDPRPFEVKSLLQN
jgi:hypothetical protein